MTPADRELILAAINDAGYGPEVPMALLETLAARLDLDRDQRELLDAALYHSYWQGWHDGGDEPGEADG